MDGGVEKERGFSWFSSTPQSHFVCQLSLLRRATPVGTRPPYSLPFVILPVPARSPFRLLVHRTRSTPNLKEGAFWCGTNSNIKPALKGEVDMSVSEWTEGLKKKEVFLGFRQPLSLTSFASSPCCAGPLRLEQGRLTHCRS